MRTPNYDSRATLEAINDLYRNELRLFQNLFLPSVKLEGKVRVGSRLRRRYQDARRPFQRVCEAPAAQPEQVAELQRQRDGLDPLELSRLIQIKLERIFQLSAEAARKVVRISPPGEAATPLSRKKLGDDPWAHMADCHSRDGSLHRHRLSPGKHYGYLK
ncbi:MAG: hypothetical protein ACLQOO_30310 [Terriglobia bacterium]